MVADIISLLALCIVTANCKDIACYAFRRLLETVCYSVLVRGMLSKVARTMCSVTFVGV